MPHSVKVGDTETLRWDLGRDLTGVTEALVRVTSPAGASVISRAGVIDEPVTAGIVSLLLATTDYGTGKLEPDPKPYLAEVKTTAGGVVLTHPDDGYETIIVTASLE